MFYQIDVNSPSSFLHCNIKKKNDEIRKKVETSLHVTLKS